MGNNSKGIPVYFGTPGQGEMTSLRFDEYGNLIWDNGNKPLSERNHDAITNARANAKDGNWLEGERNVLNGGVNDLDYLEEQVNSAGFQIDSIKNPYNHNNIRLHHPDNPDLEVVVDKIAMQQLIKGDDFDYSLSDILTKINTTMGDSKSFTANTNTVTIASRFSNQPAFNQQNKGSERNLIINIPREGNRNKDTLFQNIDDYVENGR